jgi:hypothetical protein
MNNVRMFSQTTAQADKTIERPGRTYLGLTLFLLAGLLASLVLAMAPAEARMRMPQVRLTGGGPEVTATYTASTPGHRWARGVTLRYQWYRGPASGKTSTFRAIRHADHRRYTLKMADHGHRVMVTVRAVRNGKTIGRRNSPPSNRILHEIKPPKLSGMGRVGKTITGKLGIWTTDWHTSVYWRRGAARIPGATSLRYRARPADAGHSISLVGLGQYRFPNGVHAIDRRVTHKRIRWTQRLILKASSSRGKLFVTMNSYARRASQVRGNGKVYLYDGSHVLKSFRLVGRRVMTFRGLHRGRHTLRLSFPTNNFFVGAKATRSVIVR